MAPSENALIKVIQSRSARSPTV